MLNVSFFAQLATAVPICDGGGSGKSVALMPRCRGKVSAAFHDLAGKVMAAVSVGKT